MDIGPSYVIPKKINFRIDKHLKSGHHISPSHHICCPRLSLLPTCYPSHHIQHHHPILLHLLQHCHPLSPPPIPLGPLSRVMNVVPVAASSPVRDDYHACSLLPHLRHPDQAQRLSCRSVLLIRDYPEGPTPTLVGASCQSSSSDLWPPYILL